MENETCFCQAGKWARDTWSWHGLVLEVIRHRPFQSSFLLPRSSSHNCGVPSRAMAHQRPFTMLELTHCSLLGLKPLLILTAWVSSAVTLVAEITCVSQELSRTKGKTSGRHLGIASLLRIPHFGLPSSSELLPLLFSPASLLNNPFPVPLGTIYLN